MKTEQEFQSWLNITVESAKKQGEEKMDNELNNANIASDYSTGYSIGKVKSDRWYAVGFVLGVIAAVAVAVNKK